MTLIMLKFRTSSDLEVDYSSEKIYCWSLPRSPPGDLTSGSLTS